MLQQDIVNSLIGAGLTAIYAPLAQRLLPLFYGLLRVLLQGSVGIEGLIYSWAIIIIGVAYSY